MYVQGVDRVFDLDFNGGEGKDKVTYGDVFLQAEQEYSRYNFEHADTGKLLEHFRDAEAECKALLAKGESGGAIAWRCRPTTRRSRPRIFSICSTRAA